MATKPRLLFQAHSAPLDIKFGPSGDSNAYGASNLISTLSAPDMPSSLVPRELESPATHGVQGCYRAWQLQLREVVAFCSLDVHERIYGSADECERECLPR